MGSIINETRLQASLAIEDTPEAGPCSQGRAQEEDRRGKKRKGPAQTTFLDTVNPSQHSDNSDEGEHPTGFEEEYCLLSVDTFERITFKNQTI